MSCSNCDEIQAKYNESIKEGQILCRKMRDYQKELSQYEAWMKESDRQQREASNIHEANFRQLISDLEVLVQSEDNKIIEEKEGGRRNVQLEAIQLVSNNLIKTYKSLKIKEFDSKYETTLTGLIQSLAVKTVVSDVNNNPTQTTNTTNSSAPSPTTGELIGRMNIQISEDLNEFRQKTQMCKEKLSQQKQMIQSLLNKISMSPSSSTPSSSSSSSQIKPSPSPREGGRGGSEDHSVSSNSENSTTSSCTSSSSSFQAQLQARANNTDYKHIAETYMCPKCQIQVDSRKIPFKKLESHIKKCDPTKLGCIFCLKLFEKSEQVLFENHVQKHLLKQTLEQSRTVLTSNQTTPAQNQSSVESQSRLSNQSSLPNNSI